MRVAFLTEMGFEGKVPANHSNMRTEFAWMHTLDADHRPLQHYAGVAGYDHIFIIFPKGEVNLNAVGAKIRNQPNPYSGLLASGLVETLKKSNKKVYFVQEGPAWMFTELEIADQINFYNMLASVDAVFAHNDYDTRYYKGLVPNKSAYTIPTLMVDDLIKDIEWAPENKVIIGGNFARWYGGFESYLTAQEFKVPIWTQTSHAMREHEDQLLHHLPRVLWVDWIKQLSSFKYAVHLMPTIAAGTFSLNCAYLGIPCIGNEKVDTQRLCHPDLSVDVGDVDRARVLAQRLRDDQDFYNSCSMACKNAYQNIYTKDNWLNKMEEVLGYE